MISVGLTVGQIEDGLGYAAELVERYGDVCLPYFLLMESALEAASMKQDVLARVRQRAGQSKLGTRMVHRAVHTTLLASR